MKTVCNHAFTRSRSSSLLPLVASMLGMVVVVFVLASFETHGWQKQSFAFQRSRDSWPPDSPLVNHTFHIEVDAWVGLDEADFQVSEEWDPPLSDNAPFRMEVVTEFNSGQSDFENAGRAVKWLLIVAVVVGVCTIVGPLMSAVFSFKWRGPVVLSSLLVFVLLICAACVWGAKTDEWLFRREDMENFEQTKSDRKLWYSFALVIVACVLALVELVLMLAWTPKASEGLERIPKGERAVPIVVWCIGVVVLVFTLAALSTPNWVSQEIDPSQLAVALEGSPLVEGNVSPWESLKAEVGLLRGRLWVEANPDACEGEEGEALERCQRHNNDFSIITEHRNTDYKGAGTAVLVLLIISCIISVGVIPLPIVSSYFPKVKYLIVSLGFLNGIIILVAVSVWSAVTRHSLNIQEEFHLIPPEIMESVATDLETKLSVFNHAWQFGYSWALCLASGLLMIVGVAYTMTFWKPRYIMLQDAIHPESEAEMVQRGAFSE